MAASTINGLVNKKGEKVKFTGAGEAALDARITELEESAGSTPDTTPTENSTKMVTSGGIWAWVTGLYNTLVGLINGKASIGHTHNRIDAGSSFANYSYVKFNFPSSAPPELVVGVGGSYQSSSFTISVSNVENVQRAISTPDSTPTANSTNFVTSGGIKTALDAKMDKTIEALSLTIDQNEKIVSSGDADLLDAFVDAHAAGERALVLLTIEESGTIAQMCGVASWAQVDHDTITLTILVGTYTITVSYQDAWDLGWSATDNSSVLS